MGSQDLKRTMGILAAPLTAGASIAIKGDKSKDRLKSAMQTAKVTTQASANVAAAERAKRLQNLQYGDTTSGLGGNSGVVTTPFRTLLGK